MKNKEKTRRLRPISDSDLSFTLTETMLGFRFEFSLIFSNPRPTNSEFTKIPLYIFKKKQENLTPDPFAFHSLTKPTTNRDFFWEFLVLGLIRIGGFFFRNFSF